MNAQLVTPTVKTENPIDLSKETISALVANEPAQTEQSNKTQRDVIRVTNSVAQYDVSASNPKALENIGRALAGSLDRDDITYFDPETHTEVRLGDVLVAVDSKDPEEVVLCHRDTAGKGILGRLACSISYMASNPIKTISMKALGVTADPEAIYRMKIGQVLAQLDREGLFGPPGASTLDLRDWEISTRNAWRDVVISRAPAVYKGETPSLDRAFSDSLRLVAA